MTGLALGAVSAIILRVYLVCKNKRGRTDMPTTTAEEDYSDDAAHLQDLIDDKTDKEMQNFKYLL